MLMSSLPVHNKDLFDDTQQPLSRIQLNKRLALLDEQDAADLLKIEQLLHWSQIKGHVDQALVDHTIASIKSINSQSIKNIVTWRLELRVILAALRMRKQGVKTPPTKQIFGFDYWYYMMTKYWHQPDLGLGHCLPWIEEANELLQSNQALALERLLFSVVWEHYHRQNFGHYFDFDAVVIYVLRWDIVSRWTSNDKALAVERFNGLLKSELQKIYL